MFNPEGTQNTSFLTIIMRLGSHLRRGIWKQKIQGPSLFALTTANRCRWHLQYENSGLFFLSSSFKYFSFLLQKIMSPPSILQTNLLNTQKQDKGEMELDSCQSIETGSKNGSFFTNPRHPPKLFHAFMFFSVLTYYSLMDCLYYTRTRRNKTRKGEGETGGDMEGVSQNL